MDARLPHIFPRRLFFAFAVVSTLLLITLSSVQPAYAITPTAAAPIKISSATPTALPFGNPPGNTLTPPVSDAPCFLSNGNWVVVWIQSGTVGAAPVVWDYSYSTDGVTWSAAATLYTSSNGTPAVIGVWSYACSGTTLSLDFNTVTTNTNYQFNAFSLATLASPVASFASDQTATGVSPSGYVTWISVQVDAGGNFWVTAGQTGAGGGTARIYENGVFVTNGKYGTGNNVYGTQAFSSNLQVYMSSTTQTSIYSSGVTTNIATRVPGYSAQFISSGTTYLLLPTGASGGTNIGQCYIELYNQNAATNAETTPTGIPSASCGGNSQGIGASSIQVPTEGLAVTDSGNNVWDIIPWGSTTSGLATLMFSTDGATTWTALTFSQKVGTTYTYIVGVGGLAVRSGGVLQAVAVSIDTSYNVYVQTFSTGAVSPGATTQIQTIGSCLTVPPGTFTAVNSTMYVYSGNALGYEVVNSVTFGLNSVTGSASQSVQIVVLDAPNSGSITVANPLTVIYSKVYTFTGGSTAQQITTQIGITLNNALPIASGNLWAVGVIATSHVVLQTSSLAGMTTLSSNVAASAEPPGTTFTTLGASVGTELCLQAVGSYQSLVVQSTTLTITTTSTSTVTVGSGTNPSTGGFINFAEALVIILAPTVVLAGVLGGVAKSGGAAIIGAMIGFATGTALGYYAIPTIVTVGFVFIAVLALVAMIFFAVISMRGSGGV